MRALFLIPSLTCGGAEYVVLSLLGHADEMGFRAELAVLDGRGPLRSRIPLGVTLHDLGKRSRWGILTASRNLRRLLTRHPPEIVVSFLPLANIVAWWTARSCHLPVVLNERTNTDANLRFERFGWLWRRLLPLVYQRATRVITNTQLAGEFLIEHLQVMRTHLRVIPNPVDSTAILESAQVSISHPWFQTGEPPVLVGVGRLSAEKGFHRLLEAFAAVNQRLSCRLAMLGEGPEMPRLQEKAKALGVSDQVTFLGFQENPFPYLARSAALAIPSDFEGFPNVAAEAMACGTPVVGFGGVGGLDEISDGGQAALLIRPQTASALADGLIRVLMDTTLRSSLIRHGRLVIKSYERTRIMQTYFHVLVEAAREQGRFSGETR